MKLPQELVDEIIGYLPWHHPEYIRACSLVATSWLRPSQKRLFEEIRIQKQNLPSWLKNISPKNVELLGHVRSLSYVTPSEVSQGMIGPLHRTLCGYLPSFRQLRRLTLSAPIPLPHQQIEIFSAFQNTLFHISLSNHTITVKAFITLINYFSNLESLHLNALRYGKEGGPFPPLRRRLLKKLSVIESSAYNMELFGELSELGLQFDEVVINQGIRRPALVKGVAFGATAKRLRLLGSSRCMYHPLKPRCIDPYITLSQIWETTPSRTADSSASSRSLRHIRWN